MKKLHARELSRNQSILRFDVILQHDWPIEQCLLHIRVSLAGKRRGHVLIFSPIGLWNRWRTLTETFFQGHTKIALSGFHCSVKFLSIHVWSASKDVRYTVNLKVHGAACTLFLFRLQNSPYFCVFKYARAVTLYRFLHRFWEKNRLFYSLVLV